jgi:hypothetical protein
MDLRRGASGRRCGCGGVASEDGDEDRGEGPGPCLRSYVARVRGWASVYCCIACRYTKEGGIDECLVDDVRTSKPNFPALYL